VELCPAGGGEVAFAGQAPGLPGDSVVIVALGRGPAAAPVGTGRAADVDLLSELAAGSVAGLGVVMIAAGPGDGLQRDAQPCEKLPDQGVRVGAAIRRPVTGAGSFSRPRPVSRCLAPQGLGPRAHPCGPPLGICHGETPARGGVGGGGAGQFPGRRRDPAARTARRPPARRPAPAMSSLSRPLPRSAEVTWH
jgi:hypothetical protein